MNRLGQLLLSAVLLLAVAAGLRADDWYVSTDGEPSGTFDGKPIPLPVQGEFAAFVPLKEPAPH